MKRITYHGPGHILTTPSGRKVHRGETAEVTDSDADQLTRLSHIDVTLEAEGTEPNPQEEE